MIFSLMDLGRRTPSITGLLDNDQAKDLQNLQKPSGGSRTTFCRS
jgi:hypothetical protein